MGIDTMVTTSADLTAAGAGRTSSHRTRRPLAAVAAAIMAASCVMPLADAQDSSSDPLAALGSSGSAGGPATDAEIAAAAEAPATFVPGTPVWQPGAGRPEAAGRWIVDPQGRAVIFHGENVVAKKAPYTPDSIGFSDDDIAFLQANGYNGVRLGIIWEAVEPAPGVYNEAYLDTIESTVRRLSAAGIGTLLEVHQDAWSAKYSGEGAPEWASLDDGLPATPGGLIAAQFSPAVYQAVHNFFGDAPAYDGVGIRTRFVNMWGHVAARFSSVPGVVGYSPINEPTPGWPFLLCQADLCPEQVVGRLRQLNADVAGAIRSHDSQTSIWPTAYITTALGARPQLGAPVDPNQVYAANSYTLLCNIGLALPRALCEPHERFNASRSRSYADEQNIPWAMTEFGAIGSEGVLASQVDIADENRVSWFHWNYGGPDHTTSAPSPEDQAIVKNPHQAPTGDNVNLKNLRWIQRAYPKAISGTPGRWGTTGDGVFNLSWTGARPDGAGSFGAGATSVIGVPRVAYPRGYTVQVTGGKVTSGPEAREVVVVADGSGDVTLTVTPK